MAHKFEARLDFDSSTHWKWRGSPCHLSASKLWFCLFLFIFYNFYKITTSCEVMWTDLYIVFLDVFPC